jgi:Flp pilus assembly protein TadG
VTAVTRRPPTPRRDRDGGYSVLEVAIVLPVVFFLLMVLVQWAIVWHARSVASAAAQEGLRTAEAYTATAAAGKVDTDIYLAQVAPHALPDPQVTVTRSPTAASVRVHAEVMSLIPFGHFSVDETVTGPVEKFVPAP